jgi:hypothetical protein
MATSDLGERRRSHPQWHSHLCCTEADHPAELETLEVTIPDMWAKTLKWRNLRGNRKVRMSAAILTKMVKDTERRQVGGALFSQPDYWCSIMPNTRSARWQRMGGVDFRLRRVRQQPAPCEATKQMRPIEERAEIAKQMEELIEMKVYEPVPDSEAHEQAQRERVHSGGWEAAQQRSRSSTTSGRLPTALRSRSSGTAANLTPHERRKVEAMLKNESQCVEEADMDLQAQVFYSDVFLKLEAEKARVLLDMKRSGANPHARQNAVKQDGVKTLKGQIADGDRFALWDLRKAFFQVLIQLRLRAMLRTMVALRSKGNKGCWEWVRLQYRTLSQGLCVAPELMTKLMADVLRLLRRMGFRVLIKIDDLIAVLPHNLHEAMAQAYTITLLLTKLGAVFSANKCDFSFSTRVLWHGHVFCSVVQVCHIPGPKVTKITQLAAAALRTFQSWDSTLTVRDLSKLIGSMMSALEGVDAARIMLIELQAVRSYLMSIPSWDWDIRTAISTIHPHLIQGAIDGCVEWLGDYDPAAPHLISWNGRFMFHDPPMATVYTDACEKQRGVWVAKDERNGFPQIDIALPLVGSEIFEHITLQETAAAADGLVEVIRLRDYHDCSLVSRIDATAAIKYIKCFGGRLAPFSARVKALQQICRGRHISLMVGHIKGELNPADEPSRRLVGISEFQLNTVLFHEIKRRWGPFGLDACAASWNHQLPRYLSRQMGDPASLGHDFLTFPVQDETEAIYLFPPPHQQLLVNILQRIRAAEIEAFIILPTWPTAAMGLALRMATDLPLLLECDQHLLFQPEAYKVHIREKAESKQWWLSKTWKSMTGVRLSGRRDNDGVLARHFQLTLPSSTRTPAAVGADTLMDHSASLWPVSEKSMEGARLLSQMLLSVT